jgi:simple sugar transport system substrate-binding protein
MKKIKIVGAILAAGTLLAACSGTGSDSGTAETAKKDYTYAVITHGAPGDAFWDRVKSGAEQAGKDGIVVSMANPDGLEASVKKAVAAGVPVITINSGVDKFKDFGAITHIGQTETIAGQAVGEKLKAGGSKNAICVIQEAGNVGLEERCKAVADTMGGKVENLQVDGTDDNAVSATITSKLQSETGIDTVVTLGGQYAIDAVSAVKDSGSKAKVATFDLSEDVIKDIQAGTILFAVDQQPYVQGFMGVTGLYLKSINGNDIGGGQPINSGPAFITKENADAISKFAANGTR